MKCLASATKSSRSLHSFPQHKKRVAGYELQRLSDLSRSLTHFLEKISIFLLGTPLNKNRLRKLLEDIFLGVYESFSLGIHTYIHQPSQHKWGKGRVI